MKISSFNWLFILSVLVLLLSSCSKKRNALIDNGIKGKVTSFTDTIWSVSEKFGEVVKDEINNVIKCDVDENGNITAYTIYDSDGDIARKIVQTFKGTQFDEIRTYDRSGDEESYNKYFYSKDNPERIDSIKVVSYGSKSTAFFEYLDDNDSYKYFTIDEDGEKSGVGYQYFDKEKRLIEDKSPYATTKYTYDDNGLCISSKQTSEYGGDEEREYEYGFDKKGSMIKRITYVTSGNRKAVEMLTRHIEYK